MMKISIMQVGPIGTNCYILEDEKKIAVIDPGDEAERILVPIPSIYCKRPSAKSITNISCRTTRRKSEILW